MAETNRTIRKNRVAETGKPTKTNKAAGKSKMAERNKARKKSEKDLKMTWNLTSVVSLKTWYSKN